MCKYCMDPNYDWCCPSCFKDFEAEVDNEDDSKYDYVEESIEDILCSLKEDKDE